MESAGAVNVIDLEECYLDSPPYRQKLAKCDSHLTGVEQSLRCVLKTARGLMDLSHQLSQQYNAFAETLIELGRIEANRPTKERQYTPFFGVSSLESWSPGQHIMFLAEEMKRIETARHSFTLQLETILVDPLESLVRNDFCSLKELKRRWDKQGADYLHENSRFMARKLKDTMITESATDLAQHHRTYHEASLEYVGRMNEVLEKEQVRVAEAVLTFCHSRVAFCEKELSVFEDVGPNMRFLEHAATLSRTQMAMGATVRNEQKNDILQSCASRYHPLSVTNVPAAAETMPETSLESADGSEAIDKSGYLYKRSSHAMRPVWSRRFFHLHDHVLEYYSVEGKNNSPTVRIDLRLCTVKTNVEGAERRNLFEIVSPLKTFTLQSESDRDYEQWVGAIQQAIHAAINEGDNRSRVGIVVEGPNGAVSGAEPGASGDSNAGSQSQPHMHIGTGRKGMRAGSEAPCQEFLSSYLPGHATEAALDEPTRRQIMSLPGNDRCVDCAAPNPDWASLSLGILVCIQCSGIHRSLGVHISKVRSLRLDYWEPEHVGIMRALGNDRVKEICEALYNPDDVSFYKKPTPHSSQEEKEQWIIAKYELGKFIKPWEEGEGTAGAVSAVRSGDLTRVLHWLCTGHCPDTYLPALAASESCGEASEAPSQPQGTALHLTVRQSNWEMAALLLLWAADPERTDSQGQTILHYLAATEVFSLSFLISILRRGVDTTAVDAEGRDAMAIAIEHGHGDFATVLRMFQHDHDKRRNSSGTALNAKGQEGEPERGSEQESGHEVFSQLSACSSADLFDGVPRQKKSFRKFLRHYPRLYRRLTHRSARRRNSDRTASGLAHSMASFNPFGGGGSVGAGGGAKRREHQRSLSHQSSALEQRYRDEAADDSSVPSTADADKDDAREGGDDILHSE